MKSNLGGEKHQGRYGHLEKTAVNLSPRRDAAFKEAKRAFLESTSQRVSTNIDTHRRSLEIKVKDVRLDVYSKASHRNQGTGTEESSDLVVTA